MKNRALKCVVSVISNDGRQTESHYLAFEIQEHFYFREGLRCRLNITCGLNSPFNGLLVGEG